MAGEVGGILRKKKERKRNPGEGKGRVPTGKEGCRATETKRPVKSSKKKMKKTGDALGITEDHVLFEAGIIFWVGFAQCLAPRAAELAQRTMWRVFTLGTVGFM